MSKHRKKSVLHVLDEVCGPSDTPINLSPKDAALFANITDDHKGDCVRTRALPRCPETEKVCFPSKAQAKKALRNRQHQGAGYLRIYQCPHCHSHHLTSARYDKP